MFEPNVKRKDRTAALRMRRYRARKRNGAVTAGRDGRPPDRVTLTDQQQAALDLAARRHRGPRPARSMAGPRTRSVLRAVADRATGHVPPEHANARQAVRRVTWSASAA